MNTETNDLLTLIRNAMRKELIPIKEELLLQRQEIIKQREELVGQRQELTGQRQELMGQRQELQLQRTVLGAIDLRTRKMQVEINNINLAMRAQAKEIKRLDILLEDLNERFATAKELRWD